MFEPTIRQLRRSDAGALLNFFQRLMAEEPERAERPEDLARLAELVDAKWLEPRLPHPSPVERYALCVEAEGSLVAEGEFERQTAWKERHVGELRLDVLPSFARLAGRLVDRLVARLVTAAAVEGIELLVYSHWATGAGGLEFIERAGFTVAGQLESFHRRGGAYVDRVYWSRQLDAQELLGAGAQRGAPKQRSGRETWKALNRPGPIEESKLTDFLSKQYGVPAINLREFDVEPAIIELVPKELAHRMLLLPVKLAGQALIVAMVDPSNTYAQDELRFRTGYAIEPVVASEPHIRAALERYYP